MCVSVNVCVCVHSHLFFHNVQRCYSDENKNVCVDVHICDLYTCIQTNTHIFIHRFTHSHTHTHRHTHICTHKHSHNCLFIFQIFINISLKSIKNITLGDVSGFHHLFHLPSKALFVSFLQQSFHLQQQFCE